MWTSVCAKILGMGALLLLLGLTVATLSVAATCTVPLHEGGRSSAPVLRQGVSTVAARMGAALRRFTGGGKGGGGGSAGSGVAFTSSRRLSPAAAALVGDSGAQVVAARRLLSLLDSSDGARGLGASAGIARSLAEGLLASAGAAAAAAAAAEASSSGHIASDAPTWGSSSLYSQQTCHVTADESELCTYSGVLCFDGEGPVVVVEEPSAGPDGRVDDHSGACLDERFLEGTAMEWSRCDATSSRLSRGANTSRLDFAHDTVLPQARRRWGPLNRGGNVRFREVHPSQVWGDSPDAVLALSRGLPVRPDTPALAGRSRREVLLQLAERPGRTGPHPLAALADSDVATRVVSSDVPHPAVPGLHVRALTTVAKRSVAWLGGALWVTGLAAGDAGSPLAWLSQVGSLFEAQRANATVGFGAHPKDGFVHFLESWQVASSQSVYMDPPTRNRASYKVGSQWDVPPLDVVAFAGPGSAEVPAALQLPHWYAATLNAAVQPSSAVFFDDLRAKLGPDALVCSAHGGGVTGTKHKLFSGRMDGLMWKQYAYQAVGLSVEGVKPHPRYPPRRVTILTSSLTGGESYGSGWAWNSDEIMAAIAETGMPYAVVPTLDGMTFDEAVRLMASTGILISTHGSALGNTVFLPAHAIIIELHSFRAKSNAYRHAAAMTDLHYFPVFSYTKVPAQELRSDAGAARLAAHGTRLNDAMLVHTPEYWDACESRNTSSYDSVTMPVCAAASQAHPVLVDIPAFVDALRDAVDCAASFSLKNPDWAALAPTEGMPVKPAPNRTGEDRFGING